MRILTFVALALAVGVECSQGTRDGSPEDNLPPGMTRLSHFGERASWSPDGTRIAFMEKSFGDAYEVDLATRNIRLLTHYAHPGFLRVQFLPNGDYFLIGARTFTDISTTRSRDQEMWILKADGKPGDHAVPLDHKISEGVAISRTAMKIAWSNTRGQYPDEFKPNESVIYTADVVYEGGQPRLANKKEVIRAMAPECTLEAQDFRHNDTELIYTCYRTPYADVLGVDLKTGATTVYRKEADRIQRGRGDFSRWRVHAGRIEPRPARTELELHRHLEAEARAEQPGLHPRDALG